MSIYKEKKLSFKKGGNIFIILFAGFLCFVFVKNIVTYVSYKAEQSTIASDIEELKEKNVKLNERIKTLYEDRDYVEKVAREQLNLVKEGETVFIVKGN